MIKNHTRKTILAKQFVICNSLFSKAKGMMLRKKPVPMIFTFSKEKKVSLHMFFVFFPIDVLFLGADKKIIEIKERFKPWTFYRPKSKALYIVELPAGIVRRTRTKVGDKIEF